MMGINWGLRPASSPGAEVCPINIHNSEGIIPGGISYDTNQVDPSRKGRTVVDAVVCASHSFPRDWRMHFPSCEACWLLTADSWAPQWEKSAFNDWSRWWVSFLRLRLWKAVSDWELPMASAETSPATAWVPLLPRSKCVSSFPHGVGSGTRPCHL